MDLQAQNNVQMEDYAFDWCFRPMARHKANPSQSRYEGRTPNEEWPVDKGTRIKVKSGPHSGKLGAVFWTGPDKFKGGLRLGVRTDEDETLWLSESEVEVSNARAATTKPSKLFEKGDRVRFRNNGTEGTGSVFWTGESKQGGQRLGIRDDADPDNAVWTDARFAEALNEPGGKSKKAAGKSAGKSQASGAS